ncbi:MAG: protein kinase domain-containing protein [Pseudonocardiaceae bacterium]
MPTSTSCTTHRHLRREARLLLSLSHPSPRPRLRIPAVRGRTGIDPDLAAEVERQPPTSSRRHDPTAPPTAQRTWTATRPGAPSATAAASQHLCSALRYLHSRGYLHLDIKPSNIIANHGVARLIDLSLAHPPGRCHSGIGTPGYMSPEQVSGGNLGPAVDVWGLGLVLYEAATGIQPFDIPHRCASADSHTSTLSRCELRLTRPAPRIRARRRLPADVAEVIDACLDPGQRPTLDRLAAALATLTAGTATPSDGSTSRNGNGNAAPTTSATRR